MVSGRSTRVRQTGLYSSRAGVSAVLPIAVTLNTRSGPLLAKSEFRKELQFRCQRITIQSVPASGAAAGLRSPVGN